MKTKIIIIVIALFTCIMPSKIQSQSPIGKKSKVLGVSLNLSNAKKALYESNDGDNLFNMDLNTGFSYFVTNRLEIGTGLRIMSTKYTTTTKQFGFENGISYYLGNLERKKIPGSVYPYVTLAFNYFWQTKIDANDEETKATIFSYGPAAGVTIMLSNSVAISPKLGYMMDSKKYKETGEKVKGNWFSPQMSIVFFLYEKGNSMF